MSSASRRSHWSPKSSTAACWKACSQSPTGMPASGCRSSVVDAGARCGAARRSTRARVGAAVGARPAAPRPGPARRRRPRGLAARAALRRCRARGCGRPRRGAALPVPRPGRPDVPMGTTSAPVSRAAGARTQPSVASRRHAGEGGLGRDAQRDAERDAEVGEGRRGGEARLEAELGAHPGGVHPPTVGQEAELLGREVRHPGLPQRPSRGGRRRRRAWRPTACPAGGPPGRASASRRRRR